MKLSVIIPVHNESEGIAHVIRQLCDRLSQEEIPFEIVAVNDNSSDASAEVLSALSKEIAGLRVVANPPPKGFGRALRTGIEHCAGDAAVFYMGDASDDPADVVTYYRELLKGYDCVFGSRFMKGSNVCDYPRIKLYLNRAGNLLIRFLFMIRYNDVSNAFKMYRIEVLRAIGPLVSQYFNITVEIPLKALVRGYTYSVIPINWNGRKSGVSKYRIKELSRKYFFSILYVWLEKMLLSEELRARPDVKRS
jgi:dolichol-phosphate mannosyltransferase